MDHAAQPTAAAATDQLPPAEGVSDPGHHPCGSWISVLGSRGSALGSRISALGPLNDQERPRAEPAPIHSGRRAADDGKRSRFIKEVEKLNRQGVQEEGGCEI